MKQLTKRGVGRSFAVCVSVLMNPESECYYRKVL